MNLEKEIERLITIKNQNKKQLREDYIAVRNNKVNSSKEKIESNVSNHIKQLKEAKTAHKKWMSYVQILIRLENVHEAKEMIPINYTLCGFGKWYYGEGQEINDIDGFNEIENTHQMVHDIYLQIYDLYKQRLEITFFKSIKKLKKERTNKAEKLSFKLDEYSRILFEYLDLIEEELRRRKSVLEFNP